MEGIPHDLEAEKSLLASMILDRNLIWDAMEKIEPDDFYHPSHMAVYESMLDICENGDGKIDIVSLRHSLDGMGKLKIAGGATGLSDLIDTMPDAANAPAYMTIILEHSKNRKLMDVGKYLLGDSPPSEKMAEGINKIVEITARSSSGEFMSLEESGEKYAADQAKGLTAKAFLTGMMLLDGKVSFRKENMVVLAGHPGTGKSSLALQIAMNVMMEQIVLFVSMEMSSPELWERAVQAKTGIAAETIDNPTYAPEPVREKIAEASAELRSGPRNLKIFAPRYCTPDVILGKAMATRARHGELSLVIVDYLQRVHWAERGISMVEETTKKSRAMKDMARIIGCPVMVLSQLSRNSAREGKRPQLHDLRDSGAIEQDADTVIFTHRPDRETNDAELVIGKQRHGATGIVKCKFDSSRCRFIEKIGGYGVDNASV
jgi:replicative DNA helicase